MTERLFQRLDLKDFSFFCIRNPVGIFFIAVNNPVQNPASTDSDVIGVDLPLLTETHFAISTWCKDSICSESEVLRTIVRAKR